ncbi:tetratricopeptide repeat protein, partial [Kitasatospora cineracea]|uniref:tetratricopeptide repeat protein n=1 Tax=Kitasatospora cineracea TaxID=88074 RepID=UPI0036DDE43D
MAPPWGLRDERRPLRGREGVLGRLDAAVEDPAVGGVLVVCGMGGGGKTAVALEFAARRAAAGCRVWWVEARNGPALETGMRAVARQAGAGQEELDLGDTADVLWTHLARSGERWLLIVDNADDPALLDGPGALNAGTGWIRPAPAHGTVLVTSRDSTPATWGPLARLHPIRPLTGDHLDHAAQILHDYTHHHAGTHSQARALAHRLGGLPLALRLAGTYITQAHQTPPAYRAPGTPVTYTDYQQTWETGLERLDPQHVLARTWAMSVELLEQRGHPHARALLELIASFADADLPYTLLLTPERLVATGPLSALNGTALWQHLTALTAVGLIELPDPEPGALPVLRMHPLVRDASRTPGTLAATTGILYAAAFKVGMPEDPELWATWRLLAPHILDAFHHTATADLAEPALLRLTMAAGLAGRQLLADGLYTQARAEFEAILTIERERLGDTHPDTLATRYGLARVLHDQGELDVARAEFEAILTIQRERLGDTHPDTLAIRHNLARVLRDQGGLDMARAEFEAILTIQRERLGDTHPDTLAIRHNLARVLRDQGGLDMARAEFEAILTIQRERLGDTHPDTLA